MAALCLGALLAGCTLVDTVDKRADWMNESATRFRNQTILRNIIRSAHDEPLSFAALSQIQGHNTSVNQFPSFPSLSWTAAGFGSRGLSSTNNQFNVSSDFTLNAIDDSATHAAILAPLDASTIAVFTQRSGWTTDLLYVLFIERIRIADPHGRVLATYYGNQIPFHYHDEPRVCAGRATKQPLCGPRTMVAYSLLAYLNLQFNVENGSLPGQRRKPSTQICFDRENAYPGKWSELGYAPTGGRIALPALRGHAPDSYCDQAGTWLVTEDLDGSTGDRSSPKRAKTPSKKAAANYVVFDARNNVWIELTTRSTWGIYQFLGGLADSLIERKQPPVRLITLGYPNPDELIMLNVVKGVTRDDCFVHVDDHDPYCVPDGPASRLTRLYFAILQQLAALQRAAVAFPSGPSSVRITQ
jgi:hypothetical protein